MIVFFVGGLLGLIVGLFLGITGAFILGVNLPFMTAFTFLVPFLAGLNMASGIIVIFFAIFIITLFSYVLATISLLGPVATVLAGPLPFPPVPLPLPFVPLEALTRGFLIAFAAAINFSFWVVMPIGPVGLMIGALLGLIGFLAIFPPISSNPTFQVVLGWSSWLRPLSWLMTMIGLLLFLLDLLTLIGAPAPAGIQLDTSTGTIQTTGGRVSGIRLFGSTSPAFNLGNFTFLAPALGGNPSSFTAPGVSAHETGHTLTIAAFGGLFGWINAVDENLLPFQNGAQAYGEMIPESHFPAINHIFVQVWS